MIHLYRNINLCKVAVPSLKPEIRLRESSLVLNASANQIHERKNYCYKIVW